MTLLFSQTCTTILLFTQKIQRCGVETLSLEQLEETHFLDYEWELPKKDANLTEAEFSTDRPAPKQGEYDIIQVKIK